MMRSLVTCLLLFFAGIFAGCSTYIENEASLTFEPIYPSAHVSPEGEVPTGGIFKANGNGLFASDIRARDVGDILTVALNETFNATKAQTATSAKNDTFGVTLPTGLPNMLTGGYDKNAAGLNAGTARSFAGSGAAAQSNSSSVLTAAAAPAVSYVTAATKEKRRRNYFELNVGEMVP